MRPINTSFRYVRTQYFLHTQRILSVQQLTYSHVCDGFEENPFTCLYQERDPIDDSLTKIYIIKNHKKKV